MEKSNQSIVFVQTAFIGDLFLSLPMLQFLKNKYPDHKLILICKKGLSEVFLKLNYVNVAFEVIKGDSASYQNALDSLRHYKVDLVVCPHRSLTSAFFVRKIKAPIKIGFQRFLSGIFFTKTIKYTKKNPDVVRQMELITLIDSEFASKFYEKDWSYLNQFQSDQLRFSEIPQLFKFLTKNKKAIQSKKVGLFPGSVWATKKWPAEGFSQVAAWLIQKGYTVELMGAPSEQPEAQLIHQNNSQSVNLVGKMSLLESYQRISEYDFILCNDSAPAHMAASLGVPSVVLFGPTVLDFGFRPWQDQSLVIENKKMECRPCGAHGPQVCPLGHHQCMKSISSQQVIELIEKKLIV